MSNLKGNFYVMERLHDILLLDFITKLTHVLMDNCYSCFSILWTKILVLVWFIAGSFHVKSKNESLPIVFILSTQIVHPMRAHNPEYQPPWTSGSRLTGCIHSATGSYYNISSPALLHNIVKFHNHWKKGQNCWEKGKFF